VARPNEAHLDSRVSDLVARLRGGLVPAVPVPWNNGRLDEAALAGYVAWMARHPVAGKAEVQPFHRVAPGHQLRKRRGGR